jgi:hypothetical protein
MSAAPTLLPDISTVPACFLFRSVRLPAAALTLFNRCLADLSIDAAPYGAMVNYRTIPARFLFASVTLELSLVGFRLGNPNRFSVDADPALLVDHTTITARILFGSVPMAASCIAIRPVHRDDIHAGGCVNAAPTGIFRAPALSLFLGIITLTSPLLAIRRADLNDRLAGGSLDAAPTRFAMRSGLSFRRVTFKTSLLGFQLRNPNRFSVYADPALSRYTIVPSCFFRRTVTLTASGPALRLGSLNELFAFASLQAAPTRLAFSLMRERFFF